MIDIPPEVRILPMDLKREFDQSEYRTLDDVRYEYFLNELPLAKHGRYLCHRMLRAPHGTIVLFQCEGKIVATASLCSAERLPTREDGYEKCMQFDVESIKVFDPIGDDVVRQIWPEFERFSRVLQKLDPGRLPDFEAQLRNIVRPPAVI